MVNIAEDEAETIQLKEAMITGYMNTLLKPDGRQTTVADPNNFTIDFKGGSRDPLAHWHDYYKSLDELDVDLKDAVRLRADLIYGGKWYPKSGRLLDSLFKIKMHELEEKLKSPDPKSVEPLFQKEELKKFTEYFNTPDAQRWSDKTIGPNAPGLYTQSIDMITHLENNYLVPLRTPLAGRPPPGNIPI